MEEAREIQKRIKVKPNKDMTEANNKAFTNLMLMGKLGDAAKKINNDDSIKGVHPLSNEIKNILQKKHPKGREIVPETVLQPTSTPPQPVMYKELLRQCTK